MSASEILKAAKSLPLGERIELAQELWEDIAGSDFDAELTEDQVFELDRRAGVALQYPDRAIPAEEAFARIEEQLREKR